MRTAYFCSGLAAAAVLFANTRAEACSCPANDAAPAWPRDGAVEAAVDTPLVVVATELEPVTATLVAEDGTVVELQEQHRLVPPGAFSCVKRSYAFLTAATELEPNKRYIFTVHFDKAGDGEGTEAVTFDYPVSFVTGTERRAPALPEVRLSLFGVPFAPYGGVRDRMMLDVYVETDAVEPLFVIAEGEREVLVHDVDPLRVDRPYRVGFGSIECAAVTVVDATGTTIADRVLCEPSKCTLVESIAEGGCGEESFPPVSWSTWQSLPEGCDRDALLQSADEGAAADDGAVGANEPSGLEVPLGAGNVASGATPLSPAAEEMSAGQPSQVQAVGGCGLPARRARGDLFAVSGLLLALLVRARLLRRST